MIATSLRLRDLVDHIDTRQVTRNGLPAALLARMRCYRDLIVIDINLRLGHGLGVELRFIEKRDLIRRQLLAAGRRTSRPRKIQLLAESEKQDFVTLVLGRELLVAGRLFSQQRLQCINIVRQLMQGNRHAPQYIGSLPSTLHKTLEKCSRS